MDILVRNAERSDFQAVRRIMNQVQEMHVAWRPDIYKSNDDLITEEVKESSGSDGIELQVNARNHAAYEMYKKYGFTEKSINMELLSDVTLC